MLNVFKAMAYDSHKIKDEVITWILERVAGLINKGEASCIDEIVNKLYILKDEGAILTSSRNTSIQFNKTTNILTIFDAYNYNCLSGNRVKDLGYVMGETDIKLSYDSEQTITFENNLTIKMTPCHILDFKKMKLHAPYMSFEFQNFRLTLPDGTRHPLSQAELDSEEIITIPEHAKIHILLTPLESDTIDSITKLLHYLN